MTPKLIINVATHKYPGATRSMDDQVRHVTNQVSSQPKVEQHVEDVEELLPQVHRMQITVANCSQSRDGPVN